MLDLSKCIFEQDHHNLAAHGDQVEEVKDKAHNIHHHHDHHQDWLGSHNQQKILISIP